jgi:hypothetical protein
MAELHMEKRYGLKFLKRINEAVLTAAITGR